MTYSYQKQIERLMNFVSRYKTLVEPLHRPSSESHSPNCLYCEAVELLNDEPIKGKLMGTGEGNVVQVRLLESPATRIDEGLNPKGMTGMKL